MTATDIFSPEIRQEIIKTLQFTEGHLKETTGIRFTTILSIEKETEKEVVPDDEKAAAIIKACCDTHGFKPSEIKGKNRKRELAECRFMAMALIKSHTKLTLAEIGDLFSGRDHSSTSHAITTNQDLVITDKKYSEKFNKCAVVVSNLKYGREEKITITLKDLQ